MRQHLLLVGTTHNGRGDPLLLLRLLKFLVRDRGVQRLGVIWSVPSGNLTPDREELGKEEVRVQEALRNCVRLIHNSSLSWDGKSFLGRCYRSFQYEFLVALNLRRNNEHLKIVLVDDPKVRDARYNEIGNPERFLETIGGFPDSGQIEVLRKRYEALRMAYEDSSIYERMVLHPDSALLEVSPEMSGRSDQREGYIALAVERSRPDVVIGRLMHCLREYPPRLKSSGLVADESLANRLGLSSNEVLRLSEAVALVGPLPARD